MFHFDPSCDQIQGDQIGLLEKVLFSFHMGAPTLKFLTDKNKKYVAYCECQLLTLCF